MQLPTYPLERGKSQFTYRFVSEEPKGFIAKQVRFALLHGDGVARYLDRLQAQFTIYGELGDKWETFQLNRPYTAFFAQPNESFNDYL